MADGKLWMAAGFDEIDVFDNFDKDSEVRRRVAVEARVFRKLSLVLAMSSSEVSAPWGRRTYASTVGRSNPKWVAGGAIWRIN